MRPTTFWETVGDVEAETLVKKLAPTLVQMEARTIGGKLRDVGDEALVNTMHYNLAEMEVETSSDTPYDMEAKASADTLADRLAEVKPELLSETLANVKAGILHEMRH